MCSINEFEYSNVKNLVFITLANTKNIIRKSEIKSLSVIGEIYKIPIHFFNRYEQNELLAIKELLKDPEKFFNEMYIPYEPKDTFSKIYEGKKPSYHISQKCPRLHADYLNFSVPNEIKSKGQAAVIEFRQWFETVKHLFLSDPGMFVFRLHAKYGIITNPNSIKHENSGVFELENPSITELEEEIDKLIKEAGRFYYSSEKNTEILKVFSKNTFLAYNGNLDHLNTTQYSNEEIIIFLKEYDEKFKKRLKKLLIEYYRLKLNPEIKMDGLFLDKLGFKPCCDCYDKERDDSSNASDFYSPF
jgi:hypothetical protein